MAYFECIIGGGGGGESDVNLIVTCSPNFAGKTITCTNGTDTYTQTCSSTSPYTVTFENIGKGTWTISGVISGQTFSQSVVIGDYTAQLNDVPEGSTVTPVNDIQIWLNCANIWDKSYTTLNEVLADNTTLLALISSNNAVDYMARSTTWANAVVANQTAMGYIGNNDYCADKLLSNSTWLTAICNSTYFESVLNVKVPTMTSATTPSGTVFADPATGWNQPYYVFNDSLTDYFQQNSSSPGVNIGYQFVSQIRANIVEMRANLGGNSPTKFKVQGSNDGSSWIDLSSEFNTPANNTKFIFANNQKYNRYRIYYTNVGQYNMACTYKVQFYGR